MMPKSASQKIVRLNERGRVPGAAKAGSPTIIILAHLATITAKHEEHLYLHFNQGSNIRFQECSPFVDFTGQEKAAL
jgi:hypothetical protein